MKLRDLLLDVPIIRFTGDMEEEILGIAYSSQFVQPGYLFAALKGEKRNGFDFIGEAREKGARAILSERPQPPHFLLNWIQVPDAAEALGLVAANFYSHPSLKMKVIGVTGTKGKTTVTYLLEAIFQKAGFVPGVIGTISYRWLKREISAQRTTPEAPDIQRMLKEMHDNGVTHCIMEVSSHSLDRKRVCGVKFDLSIFTNLSGEHLDYHGTMEAYFESKKKLFFMNHKKNIPVINVDDPWGKKLIDELPLNTISFGLSHEAIVRAEKFNFASSGIEATVSFPGGKISFASPLVGKHNLYNILAAIAASLTLNLSPEIIKEGIDSLHSVPGRFERVANRQGIEVIVDYAHTDAALRCLLESVRDLKPQKIILVFGAGGDRDKAKRPRMGEVAAALADWTFLTSDNPRSEDPLAIIADIEMGFLKKGARNYTIFPDRKEAIEKALQFAQKGDYVLIAGKGHENYQILKDHIIPFSDQDVVKEILKKKEMN